MRWLFLKGVFPGVFWVGGWLVGWWLAGVRPGFWCERWTPRRAPTPTSSVRCVGVFGWLLRPPSSQPSILSTTPQHHQHQHQHHSLTIHPNHSPPLTTTTTRREDLHGRHHLPAHSPIHPPVHPSSHPSIHPSIHSTSTAVEDCSLTDPLIPSTIYRREDLHGRHHLPPLRPVLGLHEGPPREPPGGGAWVGL